MSTKVTVDTHGFFFTGNPVGALHQEIYRVIRDAGEIGASAWASQLSPGHGYLTGALQSSIEPRLLKASRGATFTGRGRVIAGAKGHELVRFYSGKIDRKYKSSFRGRAASQAWADSNAGSIAARFARAIDR